MIHKQKRVITKLRDQRKKKKEKMIMTSFKSRAWTVFHNTWLMNLVLKKIIKTHKCILILYISFSFINPITPGHVISQTKSTLIEE